MRSTASPFVDESGPWWQDRFRQMVCDRRQSSSGVRESRQGRSRLYTPGTAFHLPLRADT
jgi:hypothetical protein